MDWVSGFIGGGSGVLNLNLLTRMIQFLARTNEAKLLDGSEWPNVTGQQVSSIYLPPIDDFNFVFGAEVDVYLIRIVRFHASLLTFI